MAKGAKRRPMKNYVFSSFPFKKKEDKKPVELLGGADTPKL
jgi:hypothetical protein